MAINFYREEAKTRRQAKIMIVLFSLLSVLLTILVVQAIDFGYYIFARNKLSLPVLLTISTLFLSSIVIASILKLKQLSDGNYSAIISGGVPLKDVKYTRATTLRNTVEEMAISANIPVPHIYVLEMEPSVNAISAGINRMDMSICITRGCLEKLNRDELQAIAAYQMAQIINGNARLNTLMYGVLFGLQYIHSYLSTFASSSMRSIHGSSDQDEDKIGAYSGVIWFSVVLFPLWLVAYTGNFFAKIIKSIICRENVFQADAVAVKLNRNPNGLASVLQKSTQTRFSYILFADTFLLDLEHLLFTFGSNPIYEFKLLHTHPDALERIRRIMPEWNGELPKTSDLDENPHAILSKEDAEKYHPESAAWALGIAAIASHNNKELKDEDYWFNAARQPEKAVAVVAAMLAMHNTNAKQVCLDIAQMFDTKLNANIKLLLEQCLPLDMRFKVLSIAIPNVRLNVIGEEKIKQYKQFLQSIIKSDNQISLFEHCVYAAVSGGLKASLFGSFLPNLSKDKLARQIAELLMLTANHCNNGKNAEQNFQAACQEIGIPMTSYRSDIPLGRLSSLLLELDRLSDNDKQELLTAISNIIESDEQIDDSEKDWLYAMKIALDLVNQEWQNTRTNPSTGDINESIS